MAILHSNITPYKYKYQATGSGNVVIKAEPGFLHAIVVGAAVVGGTITIADNASSGNVDVMLYLAPGTTSSSEGNPIGPKTYIVDLNAGTGLCATQDAQTKVTYIYY